MIYLLLIIIAIGVLLISREGKKILRYSLKISAIFAIIALIIFIIAISYDYLSNNYILEDIIGLIILIVIIGIIVYLKGQYSDNCNATNNHITFEEACNKIPIKTKLDKESIVTLPKKVEQGHTKPQIKNIENEAPYNLKTNKLFFIFGIIGAIISLSILLYTIIRSTI